MLCMLGMDQSLPATLYNVDHLMILRMGRKLRTVQPFAVKQPTPVCQVMKYAEKQDGSARLMVAGQQHCLYVSLYSVAYQRTL